MHYFKLLALTFSTVTDVSVLFVELYSKMNEIRAREAAVRGDGKTNNLNSARRLRSAKSVSALSSVGGTSLEMASIRAGMSGEVNIGKTDNTTNPLFLSAGGKGQYIV